MKLEYDMEISPKTEKLIKDRMKKGGYASPEAVVLAGLASLQQNESFGDFEPGELDELLAEGEKSGKPLPADEVFRELRELGKRKSKAG